MRKLLILCFFLPLTVWGQSSLQPCPEKGEKHNCSASVTSGNGNTYVGEFFNGKPHGQGVATYSHGNNYVGEWREGKYNGLGAYTYPNGNKYVGEFRDFQPNGEGIEYTSNGTVIRSGTWRGNILIQSAALDINRFPFNFLPHSATMTSPVSPDPARLERDRLAAELDAERKRRQALEERLASEARERERIVAIRAAPQQTGDGSPDDQTCRQYGFVVATTPYAN